MTTVELKTVITAPEPDRTKKYVAHAVRVSTWGTKPSRQDPLTYVGDLGWTWDGAPEFYTWNEYVDQFHAHFPLEEKGIITKVMSSGDELKLVDVGEDKLNLRTDGFNILVQAESRRGSQGYTGAGFVLDSTKAAQLLTYLEQVLEIDR